MKNYLMCFALLFTMAMITSCGEDETCSDGVQNGNETGIDCGGDCAACETTPAEDKANIEQTFDDLLTCMGDVKDSRAVTVLFKNFLNMSDGDALNENWIEDMTEDLESVIDIQHVEDNSRFDLAYHAGTHVFNSANQTWTKTNNVTDKVIFQFPSQPSETANNVELLIDVYEDQEVTIDGETMYVPTSMHASMNVDNSKTFEITLSDITYADNQNFQIPVALSAQIFMDPMEIDLDVTRVSTTSYEMAMSFSDADLCDIKVNAQVELKDDDFENLSNSGFESVAVQVNLGQMSIQTLGDVATLISLDDPTEAQFNSLLDVDVLFNDVKIGDLEINEDMETVLIFYKDGTSEDTSVFYDGFFDDIASIWSEFFG